MLPYRGHAAQICAEGSKDIHLRRIAVTFVALQPFVVFALWRALVGVRAAVDESRPWTAN